jgi:protein-disulfide isomerase
VDEARSKRQRTDNAWKATTWILAVFLALSMLENAVLAWRVAGGATGASTGMARGAGHSPDPAPATNQPRQPSGVLGPVVDVGADGGPVLGSRAAKVEVIAFLDYQCSFCAHWHEESFGQMQKDYISTGRVRFVTRDYPLPMHARARAAAVAADCVRALTNDKTYYRYQEALFGTGDLTGATLERQAIQLGIEGKAFKQCTTDANGAIAKKIDRDMADGAAAGVEGTPTFFVNGRMLVGAQPYVAFKAAIDSELTKVEGTR